MKRLLFKFKKSKYYLLIRYIFETKNIINEYFEIIIDLL